MPTHEKTRETGTNPRAMGDAPRANGINERATARNKWALRNWKRAQEAKAAAGPAQWVVPTAQDFIPEPSIPGLTKREMAGVIRQWRKDGLLP